MAEYFSPSETTVITVEAEADEPLVLPDEFKTALGVEDGGTFTAIKIDGVVLLVARPLVSIEALEGMRKAVNEAGVSLNDLLDGLAEIRTEMLRERYGITPAA